MATQDHTASGDETTPAPRTLTIDPKPEILHPYIAYAERQLIWEHVEAHGGRPVCNSE